jgi:hypothetical protein
LAGRQIEQILQRCQLLLLCEARDIHRYVVGLDDLDLNLADKVG